MNYSLLVSPISGAIIGYFTNWLAIKMLFKPHNEIKIGSLRVPFTPGLIPKEKKRIAASLGDTVGNYLLTAEVLAAAVKKPEISGAVEGGAERIIEFLKNTDKTVGEILSKGDENGELCGYVKNTVTLWVKQLVLKDGFSKKVTDVIFGKIKDITELEIAELDLEKYEGDIKYAAEMLFKGLAQSNDVKEGVEKCLWDYLLSLTESEKALGEVFSEESVRAFKDYASVKSPDVVNGILEAIAEPDADNFLRDKVREAISRNAGLLGMFINTENIYDKAVGEIKEFFNNPANSTEIDKAVDMVVDKLLSYTVGQSVGLVTGEMREITVKKAVSAVMEAALTDKASQTAVDKIIGYAQKEGNRTVKELIYDYVPEFDKLAYERLYTAVDSFLKKDALTFVESGADELARGIFNTKIKDISVKIGEDTLESVKEMILASYTPVAVKAAPFVVEAINIPKIVEERINSFDMNVIEGLILSIANKELKAITWVGALLGFVIGFVPVITQIIGL